ncbi:MAG: DUF499 domain-containing protein, partial [Planctomycetaceae bacterium]|nr:DUF499 domain-containing protein [Planctomycetaceae bacterium]
MSKLIPWYKVVSPREDIRDNRPLDASEFAVHLDHVRNGKAPEDYKNAGKFFARTFITANLRSLAVDVLKRLNGITTATSAVFNMSTQFGGGKTHALTLLYHLANEGLAAKKFNGVQSLLQDAGLLNVPASLCAVFVGTEFDSITGRGSGADGDPKRKTPWGEIAWQIAGQDGFEKVAQHDDKILAPAGDVLDKIFPQDKPALILMDEIMNFISRSDEKHSKQFYNFLQNLSEFARSRSNIVLAVSVPASEIEMHEKDQANFERIKKLLNRLGKAVIMSVESETSEIIRRRLFEWDGDLLKKNIKDTAKSYAEWIGQHKNQLPGWFPIDEAAQQFEATYPFHPTVISVFERKWQAIQRFQRTRGILRLLALWVADAYQKGFKSNQQDLLISLGTAPVENSLFRTALFEQLGESNLDIAVTTDIAGRPDSHSKRLDSEAVADIKKKKLHQKIATSIFFESNGGQIKEVATEPEIRLDIAEPDLDIGNIETALDAIVSASYYLVADNKKYRFSLTPNLNKLLADRKASVTAKSIDERIITEIKKCFMPYPNTKTIFWPNRSRDIADEAILTFVILSPEMNHENVGETEIRRRLEKWTLEHGDGMRRFKNAPVWVVPESDNQLRDNTRNLLAWEAIQNEIAADLRLDDVQIRQLDASLKKAKRDLTEAIWRTYRNIYYLEKDNILHWEDMGLVTSSSSDSLLQRYITTLRSKDVVVDSISPSTLIRHWAPAFTEWSTKDVKDAFFASPLLPRLLKLDAVLKTLQDGVVNGKFAYVGKTENGKYEPFLYKERVDDIEISTDMFIIRHETAEEYLKKLNAQETILPTIPSDADVQQPNPASPQPETPTKSTPLFDQDLVHKLSWSGTIPYQKWQKFYTTVLTRLNAGNNNIEI